MSGESKVIVISSGEDVRENFAITAKECGFASVSVSDGTDVRPIIEKGGFDLVIINTPLADEFGLDLISFTLKNTNAAVIAAASQKNCDEINRKLGEHTAMILPKPLNKAILAQSIRFAMSSRAAMLKLEAEKEKLETKLANMKQIDRAKCVLIQYLRISEAEAHRQIQKRAMDQRVPEIEIAMDILRTYEM